MQAKILTSASIGWSHATVCARAILPIPESSSEEVPFQHPPNDAPAISLRFTEPPSDVGTGGAQMGEDGPGAAPVVLAACVELSGFSPGICKGVSGFVDGAALIAPGAPPDDPFGVAGPVSVGLPDNDREVDGKEAVGRLSGSEPIALWPSA